MKKKYALVLAVAVSVSAMAFRPASQVETNAEVTRIKAAEQAAFNQQVARINETKWTPLVVAALEVDSKVLVITAVAAVTRLIENEPLKNVTGKYKAMLKDIDMRSLDKNK